MDITKCSPTKLKPRCSHCFRMTAPNDKHYQSYSNFYDECDRYYWPVTAKPTIRISISATDYNEKMDKIIAKYDSSTIDEALIALLYEANKYTIASDDKTITKKGKHGQKVPKTAKRVRK